MLPVMSLASDVTGTGKHDLKFIRHASPSYLACSGCNATVTGGDDRPASKLSVKPVCRRKRDRFPRPRMRPLGEGGLHVLVQTTDALSKFGAVITILTPIGAPACSLVTEKCPRFHAVVESWQWNQGGRLCALMACLSSIEALSKGEHRSCIGLGWCTMKPYHEFLMTQNGVAAAVSKPTMSTA
jgi:hypothetical protein